MLVMVVVLVMLELGLITIVTVSASIVALTESGDQYISEKGIRGRTLPAGQHLIAPVPVENGLAAARDV